MSSALYRLGRFAARHPWRVIGAWLLAAAVVIAVSGAFGKELEDSFAVPGLDSQEAVDLLEAAGSDQAGLTAQVVVTLDDPTATFLDSAAARDGLADLVEDLAALPDVVAVGDPLAEVAAEGTATAGVLSPDGRVAVVQVQYPVMEELTVADLDELKEVAAGLEDDPVLGVEMGGDLFSSFEEAETGFAEMLGIAAAVVILLVAFGSLIAMGLPIGMSLFGLALGISSMALVAHLVEIPSWTPQLASMIGLGVGIDYALFLVTRHRENLARGVAVDESIGRSVATAGQAVIFAGGTVVISILGLTVAGVPFVTAAAVATSTMVLIMVIAAVTLVPAFLGLIGARIHKSPRRPGRASTPGAVAGGGWWRWGRHVSNHAGPYAVGVTVFLLVLTAPVLALRLGFPDQGTLPESRTERLAYDLVADGFGPGVNGPLVIAVDLADDRGVLEPLVEAVRADPGVAAVDAPVVSDDGRVASVVAFPTTAPQDDATQQTVERLRREVFPSALEDSPARAHVGGRTANFADVGDRIAERLPWFIGAVLVLSFVLLTVVFRSLVVALKAALLNLLSIGAAYGVLVAVFQWGWGKGLIGLETTVPIVSFVPMFMFAILFGLSMDYEVFLLSRVREEYVLTGDNESSVIQGIAGTARVITSAALIMISVFFGFVLGDDPAIKMFGLGLATAILVDATIVRLVLVPAAMKLMGDANWYLPAWLDRLLPAIDMESFPAAEPVTSGELDEVRRPVGAGLGGSA